jgi:hypothetical protein
LVSRDRRAQSLKQAPYLGGTFAMMRLAMVAGQMQAALASVSAPPSDSGSM